MGAASDWVIPSSEQRVDRSRNVPQAVKITSEVSSFRYATQFAPRIARRLLIAHVGTLIARLAQ